MGYSTFFEYKNQTRQIDKNELNQCKKYIENFFKCIESEKLTLQCFKLSKKLDCIDKYKID